MVQNPWTSLERRLHAAIAVKGPVDGTAVCFPVELGHRRWDGVRNTIVADLVEGRGCKSRIRGRLERPSPRRVHRACVVRIGASPSSLVLLSCFSFLPLSPGSSLTDGCLGRIQKTDRLVSRPPLAITRMASWKAKFPGQSPRFARRDHHCVDITRGEVGSAQEGGAEAVEKRRGERLKGEAVNVVLDLGTSGWVFLVMVFLTTRLGTCCQAMEGWTRGRRGWDGGRGMGGGGCGCGCGGCGGGECLYVLRVRILYSTKRCSRGLFPGGAMGRRAPVLKRGRRQKGEGTDTTSCVNVDGHSPSPSSLQS